MIFGIPLAIWLGFLTFACLLTTFLLGIAMFYFQKPVFKFHRFFAFTTMTLVLIHIILGFLLWFLGVLI